MPTPDVLIELEELPEPLRPCFLNRHGGVTVIVTDPRTPRVDWLAWTIENLTVPERNVIRAAHGEPPVPARLSDACSEGLVRPAPSMLVKDRRKPRLDEVGRVRERRPHLWSNGIVRASTAQDRTWLDITRRLAM